MQPERLTRGHCRPVQFRWQAPGHDATPRARDHLALAMAVGTAGLVGGPIKAAGFALDADVPERAYLVRQVFGVIGSVTPFSFFVFWRVHACRPVSAFPAI
mmetsp:Transcript_65271/g.169590  ORF Transcript_65271/g.169590 Transcript_65271/m.169590 type:complete len:101 (-) Transcript_65271:248-550(-)